MPAIYIAEFPELKRQMEKLSWLKFLGHAQVVVSHFYLKPYVMALIESEMPVNKTGNLINENAHRLWTIFNYWIRRAYSADQPKPPKKLGLDETSKRKATPMLP